MSGLRNTHRRLLVATLLMGALILLVSGCYRDHLGVNTGKNYYSILGKQTRATYSRGQKHRGMGAELADYAMKNVYGDAKKSAGGSAGGGPQLIQLQR